MPPLKQYRTMKEAMATPGDNLLPAWTPRAYRSRYAEIDSKGRVLWSSLMDKGPYKNPTTYVGAHVLMLYWADDSGDFSPKQEIDRLQSVLEEKFHYLTEIKTLDSKTPQKLQVQVNKFIADFVWDHDGPNTLLMVYYAGHGKQGDFYGAMELIGQSSPDDEVDEKKEERNRVVWNRTEDLLRSAEADILQIFDCCHAGTLALGRGQERKAFEYLAATKSMEGTPLPGEKSFTSALIFALERLLCEKEKQKGRFTTFELWQKIQKYEHWDEEQIPVLSNRQTMFSAGMVGGILLHPILKDSSTPEISAESDMDVDPAEKHSLTIRFDFDKKPEDKDLEALGIGFNTISESNPSLCIAGVQWGGIEQVLGAQILQRAEEEYEVFRKEQTNAWGGWANDQPYKLPDSLIRARR